MGVKKSEKEKQEALVKMQENAQQQTAKINDALSNLKNEINNEIMKIDLKLKQEKNKDVSLINEKIVNIERNVERNGKEILEFTNILAENKSKQTEIQKNQETNVINLEKRIVEVENG